MRFIQQSKDKPEALEVAWMWLPTFIGQNTKLLKDLDLALDLVFPPPLKASEEKLQEIHEFVIDFLCEKLKIPNLDKYLKGIAWVGPEGTVSPEGGQDGECR